MKIKLRTYLLAFFCLFLIASQAHAVTVNFYSADISGGTAALPIEASAEATVTAGPGYLDVELTNTSPLGPILTPNGYANPFITQMDFKFYNGFTMDEANSFAESVTGDYFAQGPGGIATQLSVRTLYYNVMDTITPGMDKCFITGEADNIKNDSTIGSLNILDGSNIPQEGWANGFLQPDDPKDSNLDHGTVFDTVRFHIALLDEFGNATTDIPDTSFYLNSDSFVVKFQGGGDYSEKVPYVVPEPTSLLLLGSGLVGLIGLRKKFK